MTNINIENWDRLATQLPSDRAEAEEALRSAGDNLADQVLRMESACMEALKDFEEIHKSGLWKGDPFFGAVQSLRRVLGKREDHEYENDLCDTGSSWEIRTSVYGA